MRINLSNETEAREQIFKALDSLSVSLERVIIWPIEPKRIEELHFGCYWGRQCEADECRLSQCSFGLPNPNTGRETPYVELEFSTSEVTFEDLTKISEFFDTTNINIRGHKTATGCSCDGVETVHVAVGGEFVSY